MNAKMLHAYVVYRTGPEGKSVSWGLVKQESDTSVQGINEKGLPYSEDHQFDVPKKDVIAVLGRRPHFGSAYGCQIEPYLRTIEHASWGSIHFFAKLEEPQKTALRTGLAKVFKKLKHHGLTGFLPIDIEVRNKRGKWAGSYLVKPKDDERDLMKLHPKDWDNTQYLVAHEAGHGVWFRLMTPKQQARWIALYHSYLTVRECSASVVKELRDGFCGQSAERVRDFRGQQEEGNAEVFDLCIDHICSYHGMTVQDLDMLIHAEEGAVIRSMWPTSKVLKTDYEYPISEYAMVKPQEFFAEAFAFWLMGAKLPNGIKLPKKVSALIETQMQRVGGKRNGR